MKTKVNHENTRLLLESTFSKHPNRIFETGNQQHVDKGQRWARNRKMSYQEPHRLDFEALPQIPLAGKRKGPIKIKDE